MHLITFSNIRINFYKFKNLFFGLSFSISVGSDFLIYIHIYVYIFTFYIFHIVIVFLNKRGRLEKSVEGYFLA